MIIDHISKSELYIKLGSRIAKAFKYLAETDFSKLEPGKYEIGENNVYAIVQQYETKPVESGKWEAHRKYIDIQYIVCGEEQIGYAHIDDLKVSEAYNEEKDFLFLEGSGSMLHCKPGTFILFAPQDAHMPCLAVGKPAPVKKVVMKICMEQA